MGVNSIHEDISVDGNGGATAAWTEWNAASGKYFPVIKKYTSSTLSTNDITNNKIKIYPNPAVDFIKIVGITTEEESYTIYNILGKDIISGTLENNQNIPIKNLKTGLYFLKFHNGNVFKFIKE